MSEQLDLGSVISILIRRRGVILAAGVIGAVAGLLFLRAHPPLYGSSTLLLLPQQQDSTSQPIVRDMVTEARIATSDVVLDKARKRVHPALSSKRIHQLVTADSPSQNMLHLVARAPSARGAEELAQAVADSEIAYERLASSSLSDAKRAALDARQAKLERQLATVNQEIQRAKQLLAGKPPQARAAQTALVQLTAQQSRFVLGIDGIKSQRSNQETGPEATLVQGATPAERPRLLLWQVIAAFIGMLAAAGLAGAVTVALVHRDRRLRTRDEIADALGSPVLGSLKSLPVRTTAGWSELLESYRPSAVDAWSLRQILDRAGAAALLAGAGGDRSGARQDKLWLVLVVMAEDSGALAVAGQLASHTASLGVSTCLTTRQRHAFADALWAASAVNGVEGEVRPGLRVDPRRRKTSADITVELVVVDRQQPTLPDLKQADAVLLVVSSGVATGDDLARVAVTTYEAGGRFSGAVVADADSLDHTTGRLLRAERAVEPMLPMKLIGVEADDWRERNGRQ